MQDRRPLKAAFRRLLDARVFSVPLVVVVHPPVRIGRPDQLRHGVRQRPEPLLALAQGLLCAFSLSDVLGHAFDRGHLALRVEDRHFLHLQPPGRSVLVPDVDLVGRLTNPLDAQFGMPAHRLIGGMIGQVGVVMGHEFVGRIAENVGDRLAEVPEHPLCVVHVDEMRPFEVLDQATVASFAFPKPAGRGPAR